MHVYMHTIDIHIISCSSFFVEIQNLSVLDFNAIKYSPSILDDLEPSIGPTATEMRRFRVMHRREMIDA